MLVCVCAARARRNTVVYMLRVLRLASERKREMRRRRAVWAAGFVRVAFTETDISIEPRALAEQTSSAAFACRDQRVSCRWHMCGVCGVVLCLFVCECVLSRLSAMCAARICAIQRTTINLYVGSLGLGYRIQSRCQWVGSMVNGWATKDTNIHSDCQNTTLQCTLFLFRW